MTIHALIFLLCAFVFGAIQMFVGVAIGIRVRRSNAAVDNRNRHSLQQAGAIAKRLQRMASEMSSIVGAHRSELEHASQMLAVDSGSVDESAADLVGNVIGGIVYSNQTLQSKLNLAESRLQEQAVQIEAHISRSLTDPLTGLPNRREFNERLEERMAAWTRRREVFSLLLLDVDHFKKLNDQHGHLAGDEVLAAIGGVLRGAIRREDAIARYGGEEFAILLPNTSLEQAVLVALNVREAVARTVVTHNEHNISVTVSCGAATIQSNEPMEMLIGRADEALYAAKEAGRNCTCAHDGMGIQAANGQLQFLPTTPASRIVELNCEPDENNAPDEDSSSNAGMLFGAYLPRESISAALSETCQELRRYLEQRGQDTGGPEASAGQITRLTGLCDSIRDFAAMWHAPTGGDGRYAV